MSHLSLLFLIVVTHNGLYTDEATVLRKIIIYYACIAIALMLIFMKRELVK